MAEKKQYKLDMFNAVLPAIDRRDMSYWENLTDEERKAYAPLVLMRAMSSLGNQNNDAAYELLMVNDLVNIRFWELTKHPELQHKLLCLTGLGKKQYHPWLSAKGSESKTKLVDSFLVELNPSINQTELKLLKQGHTAASIKQLAYDAGKSEQEIIQLVEDAKKLNQN